MSTGPLSLLNAEQRVATKTQGGSHGSQFSEACLLIAWGMLGQLVFTKHYSGWWFQIFLFPPLFGEDSHFD